MLYKKHVRCNCRGGRETRHLGDDVDGYKKIIFLGCLVLGGGYFLPWCLGEGVSLTGYALVENGVTTLRPMYAAGIYDQNFVLGFSAIALPAVGALLSFLYCMVKPLNRNGALATFIFLLPALTLSAIQGFVYVGGSSSAHFMLDQIFNFSHNAVLDLQQTGGLWMIHLGAAMMLLGRAARSSEPRRGLR